MRRIKRAAHEFRSDETKYDYAYVGDDYVLDPNEFEAPDDGGETVGGLSQELAGGEAPGEDGGGSGGSEE